MVHYGGYFSARERIWTWTGHQNTLSLGCQPNLQRACYGILSVMATSRLTIEIRHIAGGRRDLDLRMYHPPIIRMRTSGGVLVGRVVNYWIAVRGGVIRVAGSVRSASWSIAGYNDPIPGQLSDF